MPLTPSLAERGLTSYDFSRWTGNQSGADFDFQALAQSLDCTRDFYQVGIIYADGHQRYLVRPSKRYANNNESIVTHVIVTKIPQLSQYSVEKSLSKAIESPSIAAEVSSTMLSCGAMSIAVFSMFSGAASVPLTGGTSIGIIALGYAGTIATAMQCGNGLIRLYDITFNAGQNVTWLDSEGWYITISTIMDVVSLISAGAAIKQTVSMYRKMRAVSSTEAREWLKSIPRQDRARLTFELIKIENPRMTDAQIKTAIKMGIFPKRFPSSDIQNILKKQLNDALTGAAAFAGSALSGTIRNPSNLLKSSNYAVSVIQSIPVLK
ncbi:hypothetical protein [Brenneria tiliae]|uniref:hypothetical protein n=1 Tax=Brenneria tiliae TaxID=2914984 RepID=UPI00201491BC|nr:hypothetical protein [Brenneria tiliae]MCL2899706.1 hypothetical protein [Brenneria tiliae]MCL2904084.1 hypothetical protein [Brenneria tiliae]